jgi:RIO-like serine/threonine protein kinase
MSPRIPFLSAEIDRYLALRECRQLRRADGVEGVPRLLARPAPNVYLREYLEGTPLPRAPAPPREFFDRLARIAAALHARGVTHNDLHKEANVIVRPDGSPGVIDFQLSLSLPRGSGLHRLLARFDLYHVAKNRRHRTGEPLSSEEEALAGGTRAVRRIHRLLVKKPMNLLTRRLFPGALGKLPTDTDP